MIRAVLFDMDGVLLDSFDAWHELVSAAAAHFGLPPISAGEFREVFGQPTRADVNRFFTGQTVESVEAFYAAHAQAHPPSAHPLPGATAVIGALDERSVLSAVVTNTPSGLARSMLEGCGIVPHALVGGSDVPRPKPAPDMIFRACEVLGVEPWDALVVGDTAYDRQAAAAAGTPFAGIGGMDGNFTIAHLGELLGIVDGTFD